jgi:hypothetical protein
MNLNCGNLIKYIQNYIVFFGSLLLQYLLVGKYWDNSIISSYVPTSSDSAQYVSRAATWESEGFKMAFQDAYRMPGYPFILKTMEWIFPDSSFLATRIFQTLLLAASAVLIKITLKKLLHSNWVFVFTGIYIMLPLWHFTPLLLAESLTGFLVVVILWYSVCKTTDNLTKTNIIFLACLVGFATYLKPNNLLLMSLVGVLIYSKNPKKFTSTFPRLAAIVLMLLAPWLFFVSVSNSEFIGLTTTSGTNLYVGTGMVLDYNGGLLEKAAVRWKVDPRENLDDLIPDVTNFTLARQNHIYTQKSIEIWKSRPLSQVGFGFEKILIAFGIFSNSLKDAIIGLFSLISFYVAFCLLRIPGSKFWGLTLLLPTLGLMAQAFIFQADRRFVIPMFQPIAIICLTIFFENRFSHRQDAKVL